MDVSIFSTANAPIVGQRIQQAARAARETERKKAGVPTPGVVRGEDEVDLEITSSASDDAVRSLKGNGDQETADDREQADHYAAPKDASKEPPAHPTIDLQG